MKLKEIKPGMVIHCKTQEEANILCDHLGAEQHWKTFWRKYKGDTCYQINTKTEKYPICCYGDIDSFSEMDITEFSDLILPELTAEEVIPILTEICNRYNGNEDCEGCPLNGLERICNGNECPFTFKYYKQVIEICEQWKAKHEKKEPEIETEWFWQGRIFKILKDGCYYQIKDGTGFYDTGCEYRESAEEYMKDELKEYCKTHKGEFIAVVDHVCRVRAVE